MKDTVILYHGNCPDGFAAAYAAWKKFGANATYIPVYHGEPYPAELAGREVYILDFSYPLEALLAIEANAKRLVVLDHHIGAKEAVEAVREHIFDNDHSGAGIAWKYFHPEQKFPRILAYIEHNDLWRHEMAHAKVVGAYLGTIVFDFVLFDHLVVTGEDDIRFQEIVAKGTAYREYYDHVCKFLCEQAEEVTFDGFTVLATNAPRLFRSEVGHALAKKMAPFGIVYYPYGGSWHCSLRGDGTIDLSLLAQVHGGNGHHNAASFRVPITDPLPFRFVKKSEDSSSA